MPVQLRLALEGTYVLNTRHQTEPAERSRVLRPLRVGALLYPVSLFPSLSDPRQGPEQMKRGFSPIDGSITNILSPSSQSISRKLHITFFLQEHKVLNEHWLILFHFFPGDPRERVDSPLKRNHDWLPLLWAPTVPGSGFGW